MIVKFNLQFNLDDTATPKEQHAYVESRFKDLIDGTCFGMTSVHYGIERRFSMPSRVRHLCGLQGYNPMLGDRCEGCDADKSGETV